MTLSALSGLKCLECKLILTGDFFSPLNHSNRNNMQLILTTNRNKQLGFSQSDIHIHLISTRILPVIIIKKTTDPELVRKIFSSFSNHLKERCIMSNAHTFASRVTNAIVLRENICSLAYSEVCVGIRNFRIRRFKLNLEIKSVQQIMVVKPGRGN